MNAAALATLLFFLPQSGDELHNTTWLPEVEPKDREAIDAALAEAAAERWEQAAISLDRLMESPQRRLYASGARLRVRAHEVIAERILSLPPPGLAAYRTFVDGRVEKKLAFGGVRDPATLEETAARWPAATATGGVLLRLLDLHLEEGRLLDAERVAARLRVLSARGIAGVDEAVITRRAEFLGRLRAEREARTPWPCEAGGLSRNARDVAVDAGDVKHAPTLPFMQVEGGFGSKTISWDLLRGPDGLVLVGPDRAHLVDTAARISSVDFGSLLPPPPRPPLPPRAFLSGSCLYTVLGPRPRPPEHAEAASHALLGMDFSRPAANRILFAWKSGTLPLDGLDLEEEDRKALSGTLSFSDGMIAIEEKLFVVISHASDPVTVQVYLVRLDALNGRPEWARFLCQGAPLSREPDWNRQEVLGFPDTPPSPLAAAGGKVFVCTNLGVVAAVEASTGELAWAYRYERIPAGPKRPAGWPRSPPRVEADRFLVTPTDSSFLYELFLEPRGGSVEARPARERGRFVRLLGSVGPSLYLLEKGPAETGLVRLRRDTGERYDAPPLQPGEEVLGDPLLTTREVWLSSDRGLHRYDLARDLYLLQLMAPKPEERRFRLGTPIPNDGGLALATVMGVCLRPPPGR